MNLKMRRLSFSVLAIVATIILLAGYAVATTTTTSSVQSSSQTLMPATTAISNPSKTSEEILADVFSLQKAEAASPNYFLKIDGIKGESLARDHTGEIDLLSFSWGASQNSNTLRDGISLRGTGKVHMSDMTFSKFLDKASPQLFLAVATGKHYNNATLSIVKLGDGDVPTAYYTINMKDVVVTSFQQTGSAGEDRPTETFRLSFAKIEVSYQPQNRDGSLGQPVTATWDVLQNKIS